MGSLMHSATREIVLATQNQGKVDECVRLLAHLPIRWLKLRDLGIETAIHEDGETFTENAILKAEAYCDITGHWALADDSGMMVDALGGRPGIHTARYGRVGQTQEDKWAEILYELRSVVWKRRGAQFHCAMALALPDRDQVFTTQGICKGRIAFSPDGEAGFGYDPIFYVPKYNCTMAQLPPHKKDRISHRGQAARLISPTIEGLLSQKHSTSK